MIIFVPFHHREYVLPSTCLATPILAITYYFICSHRYTDTKPPVYDADGFYYLIFVTLLNGFLLYQFKNSSENPLIPYLDVMLSSPCFTSIRLKSCSSRKASDLSLRYE